MSAREELYAALMKGGHHSPDRSEKASYLIDNLLHEEAEKIRNEKILPPVDSTEKHINAVIELLAAKIDPYTS